MENLYKTREGRAGLRRERKRRKDLVFAEASLQHRGSPGSSPGALEG